MAYTSNKQLISRTVDLKLLIHPLMWRCDFTNTHFPIIILFLHPLQTLNISALPAKVVNWWQIKQKPFVVHFTDCWFPGGGGGGYSPPKFGRYVPRQSEKSARAPERAPRSSVKMWGSGMSLSRFERETAGLRTELEPFERENAGLRNCQDASGWHSGRPLTRSAAERLAAVGGGERVEIKEILKMMVSGTAKNVKWWCSGPDSLVILWKWLCSGTEI